MNSIVSHCIGFIMICMAFLVNVGTVCADFDSFPEPNPPEVERDAEMLQQSPTVSRAVGPSEWEYHKTSDNSHPNANEQQLMWLMNRARSNPIVEGIWLADIYDRYHAYLPRCSGLADDIDFCSIAGALGFFGIDLDLLQDEFAYYDSKPPAAFDVRLYKAAKAHSDYLISIDDQNHTGQFERIDDQNFSYRRARGNVFSYSLNANYGHAAFNVDWGPDGDDGSGMQSPRGHRLAIMSIDGDYTNVGYAVVPASGSATNVGPLVITGNYCEANTAAGNHYHYNRFLVGTVWSDDDGDDFYDPGEGIGGVAVMPDHGAYYAVTSDAGGYSIPITQPGTYEVTFSGGERALSEDVVKTVRIVNESVLLDLVKNTISDSFAIDASGAGGGGASGGGGSGASGGGGCFITSNSEGISADLKLRLILMFFAIILLGATARDRRPQKE